MSKAETIKWKTCLFVGHEFSHHTYNGNGRNVAYFLAHGEVLQKFMYTSCTELENKVHALKPLEKVEVTFQYKRDKRELLEVESLTDCNRKG